MIGQMSKGKRKSLYRGVAKAFLLGGCVTDDLPTCSLLAEWRRRLSILGQYLEGKNLVLQSEDLIFFRYRVF